MPKRPASSTSSPPPSSKRTRPTPDPLSIDYRADPTAYRILRGEMNVFKTNPYSAELKVLWRFKDEAVARKSAGELWEMFERYREEQDFVGMDVTRKFFQMGYTRSMRYALRPSGRKYLPTPPASTTTATATSSNSHPQTSNQRDRAESPRTASKRTGTPRTEIPRTGEVYDDEKLRGAGVFKEFWGRVEGDEVYGKLREGWRVGVEGKKPMRGKEGVKIDLGEGHDNDDTDGEKHREAGGKSVVRMEDESQVEDDEPLRSVKREPTSTSHKEDQGRVKQEEEEKVEPGAKRRKVSEGSPSTGVEVGKGKEKVEEKVEEKVKIEAEETAKDESRTESELKGKTTTKGKARVENQAETRRDPGSSSPRRRMRTRKDGPVGLERDR